MSNALVVDIALSVTDIGKVVIEENAVVKMKTNEK